MRCFWLIWVFSCSVSFVLVVLALVVVWGCFRVVVWWFVCCRCLRVAVCAVCGVVLDAVVCGLGCRFLWVLCVSCACRSWVGLA